MKFTRRAVLAGTAALAVAPVCAPAWAQSNPVTLVVPFPPGGSTDALARMLQTPLQARHSRVVIIENKSGAAGSLGAAQVAKAAPDGSSWLVTFDSHAVIPAILDKPPVDVERDLVPVSLVGTAPYVIAANADLPYKTFADVVAASKAKPGSVKYASVGIGTLGHLAMTLLGSKAGVDLQHVPYRGGGPALNDVIGGHVDLIAGSAALITPQLAGGKLRPIMQLGRARLPALKDTQTAIEAGFPDFETLAWWGVFAPKGTPADVVGRMSKDVREILSEPAASAKLRETQMMNLVLSDPAEFNAFFTKQLAFWGKVVRDNNIRA
ncbi:Bug family tripartite tricarboxylate transporter substrate binding protein [Bradyrhizobium sp.]|uniref:Bug family tripartite tricarboxylate transporter substrate binding protein n=1 Tax=Bradyrhizobium sp. TaxID=376 RepID=UPI00403807C9